MRKLDDLKPSEIRTAVLAVFPDDGHAEAYAVTWYVAEHLHSGLSEVPDGWAGENVKERFYGRVKRALDSVAADGTLVRVGGKDEPPDGTSSGSVSYWKPEAYRAAQEKTEALRRERQELARRKEEIRRRLRVAGIALGNDGTLTPSLWEQLLDLAGL